MQPPARPKVICRTIEDDHIQAVIACLQRGFPQRPRRYWEQALERIARRPAIDDHPRYGYALVAEGHVVGVQLQIFSRVATSSCGPFAATCQAGAWTRNTALIRSCCT